MNNKKFYVLSNLASYTVIYSGCNYSSKKINNIINKNYIKDAFNLQDEDILYYEENILQNDPNIKYVSVDNAILVTQKLGLTFDEIEEIKDIFEQKIESLTEETSNKLKNVFVLICVKIVKKKVYGSAYIVKDININKYKRDKLIKINKMRDTKDELLMIVNFSDFINKFLKNNNGEKGIQKLADEGKVFFYNPVLK